MQHEVLVCLLGHTGDVIVDTGKGSFAVADDIPFLAPSDKDLVNKIVRVGYDYSFIHAFAEKVTEFDFGNRGAFASLSTSTTTTTPDPASSALSPSPSSSEATTAARPTETSAGSYDATGRHRGVYMRALGMALGTTLAEYREVILEEERAYMADRARPLAQLMFSLRKYELLFPAVCRVIRQIESGAGIHGAALCNCLYRASITGFPEVKACFDRLLFSLHQVMYNQMLAWILHGTLVDQHGEFFIAQTRLAISSDLDARDIFQHFHGGGGSSTGSFSSEGDGSSDKNMLRREFDWRSRYHINYQMLPDMYLPVGLAETVLFIGKAVQVLKEAAPEVVAADEEHIAAVITALRARPTFNLFILQKALETIRQVVSRHMWDVVVVRGRLSAHLRALRDYALLAKGNFYSNFIQESHELMLKPPNLFSTRDVNYGPFATAAASSGVADDPHFRNCRLTLDLSEFVYRAFSPHSVALLHVGRVACSKGNLSFGVNTSAEVGGSENAFSPLENDAFGSGDINSSMPQNVPGLSDNDVVDSGATWRANRVAYASGFSTAFALSAEYDVEKVNRLIVTHTKARQEELAKSKEKAKTTQSSESKGQQRRVQLDSLGSCKVTFMLQNYRQIALDGSAAGAGSTARDRLIPNALRVVFELQQSSQKDGYLEWKVQILTPRGSSPPALIPVSRKTSGPTQLQVRIEYERSPSSAANWLLRINCVGSNSPQATGEFPVELTKLLADSTGRDSCWVGFVGRNSGALLNHCKVNVCSWSYRAHFDRHSHYVLWRRLGIEYHAPWPQNLLLSRSSMETYGAIFQFLFVVRRVGHALENAWRLLTLSEFRHLHRAGDQRSAVLREMLLLRHRMAFLINALQYHIQVDVIDAQFSQLLAKIEELGDDGEVQQHLHSDHGPAETSSPFSSPRSRGSSPKSRPMTVVVGTAAGADTESNQVAGNDVDRDYLAVERAHELFLSNIVKGCFMQVKVIQKGLDDVFRTCSEFCFLLENTPSVASVEPARIRTLDHQFRVSMGFLLSLLTRSHAHQALVMRLDYNEYFGNMIQQAKQQQKKQATSAFQANLGRQ